MENMKYHALGTSTAAEDNTHTALQTEITNTHYSGSARLPDLLRKEHQPGFTRLLELILRLLLVIRLQSMGFFPRLLLVVVFSLIGIRLLELLSR